MRKDDGKFLCDKCGNRGISSITGPNPLCHSRTCNYGTVMRQVDEPEYSHGKHGNPMKDKEQMTALQYHESLVQTAKLYRAHAIGSITRNKHMNRLDGECNLTQNEIDAVLVDFINYCGLCAGGDYGLKAEDLGPEKIIIPTGTCSGHAAQQQKDIDEEVEAFDNPVTKLFGSLLAAREVSDEELVIGFVTNAMTNDLFKVTIQFLGNQADE